MTVGIVTNLHRDVDGSATKQIISKLTELNCRVLLESAHKSVFGGNYLYTDNVYRESDIIIAVGGDATIIRAAKHASYFDKPVLGVNNGTLGYMAAIEMDELSLLDKLVSSDYSIEERMIIKAYTSEKDVHYCLNDLVIKNIACSGLADVKLFNNDKPIMSYRADGVIISTPTGSTAYSLSAGGPITDPIIDCMIITPICAHSIFARSVVLSPHNRFEISVENNAKNDQDLNIAVVFDGRDEKVTLNGKNTIAFERSTEHVAKLIKIKNQSFYDILKNKLNSL